MVENSRGLADMNSHFSLQTAAPVRSPNLTDYMARRLRLLCSPPQFPEHTCGPLALHHMFENLRKDGCNIHSGRRGQSFSTSEFTGFCDLEKKSYYPDDYLGTGIHGPPPEAVQYGQRSGDTSTVSHLPELHLPSLWEHSRFSEQIKLKLTRSVGSLSCPSGASGFQESYDERNAHKLKTDQFRMTECCRVPPMDLSVSSSFRHLDAMCDKQYQAD
ncbi:hypothetical protein BgiMline_008473, partial [Biomphalaria glabrata]